MAGLSILRRVPQLWRPQLWRPVGCQPMLAGTDAALSAKRRTEGECGAISDLMSDVLDGMRCLAEKVGGEGETPGGEEGHRRLTNEMGEPASKPGAGHPNGGSKTGERPGLLGIVLDEHEDTSDRGIALGLIPAGRFCAGAVEPGSQSRHEHKIKEPIEDRFLAKLIFTHLGSENLDQCCLSVAVRDMDDARQSGEQWLADRTARRVGARD